MKELDAIIKTANDIRSQGNSIENNILKSVDVKVIAHFGNCTCLELACSNISIMNTRVNTANLGYVIRALVELLDLSQEDGICISQIKDVPVRIILSGNGGLGSKCIGFGHFMKDRFVYVDDFSKIVPEKEGVA